MIYSRLHFHRSSSSILMLSALAYVTLQFVWPLLNFLFLFQSYSFDQPVPQHTDWNRSYFVVPQYDGSHHSIKK